jgi:hypothetical protein
MRPCRRIPQNFLGLGLDATATRPNCTHCMSSAFRVRSNDFSLMTDNTLCADDPCTFIALLINNLSQLYPGLLKRNGRLCTRPRHLIYGPFRNPGDGGQRQRDNGKLSTGCATEHGPGVSMGPIGMTATASQASVVLITLISGSRLPINEPCHINNHLQHKMSFATSPPLGLHRPWRQWKRLPHVLTDGGPIPKASP